LGHFSCSQIDRFESERHYGGLALQAIASNAVYKTDGSKERGLHQSKPVFLTKSFVPTARKHTTAQVLIRALPVS
jgi:hypothetical protein